MIITAVRTAVFSCIRTFDLRFIFTGIFIKRFIIGTSRTSSIGLRTLCTGTALLRTCIIIVIHISLLRARITLLLRARCGMSLFRITFTLDGGYRFEGNVAKPRFNLTQAGRRLMTVERQGDRREGNYRLSIADGQDEALLCALVMTLDNALQRAAFA